MELTLQRRKRGSKFIFSSFYFLIFFGMGALFPLLSVYLRDSAGLSGAQIGTIMSITPIVTILVQPFWGVVTDITQKPRAVLTLSIIVTAMIGFFYPLMSTYLFILIIATLLAVFQSAVVPISDSITLTYVQSENITYGSIRLWGAIGFASAVFVAGVISEAIGLSVIFLLFSSLFIIAAMFSWKLPTESESIQVHLREGISHLVKMPRFVLFLITTFLILGPIFANNFYFGLLIMEIGGTLTGVGIAFLLAAGSEAPFMKMAGTMINKLGMLNILVVAGLISCLRWVFYFFEPPLALVYGTTIAQGFSVGLFIPAALQYVRDISPDSVRATAVSVYSAVGNGLGSWFCTFIGGFIVDFYGIGHLYLFYSLLTFLGLIVLLKIASIERKEN